MAEDEIHLDELKDLPEMSQHTEAYVGYGVKILKVAGGWIYWKQVGTEKLSLWLLQEFSYLKSSYEQL